MKKIILFGAGSDIHLIISFLKREGAIPICIYDNAPEKWGTLYDGIEVVKPFTNWKKVGGVRQETTIIISASFFDAIYSDIKQYINTDEYKILVAPYFFIMLINVDYTDSLLEESKQFIVKNKQELFSIYDISDDITERILNRIILARTSWGYTFQKYEQYEGLQYVDGYFYDNELVGCKNISFVDVGAYIGDTMQQIFSRYGAKIKNYYAFEPNQDNYNELLKVRKQFSDKEIFLSKNALGAERGVLQFAKEGSSFGKVDCVDADGRLIEVETLDEQQLEVDGDLVIKMDVEGAERDVIRGAEKTILKYRPYMAICVYHCLEDIITIPKAILAIDTNYSFVLRAGIHTHLIAIPK